MSVGPKMQAYFIDSINSIYLIYSPNASCWVTCNILQMRWFNAPSRYRWEEEKLALRMAELTSEMNRDAQRGRRSQE